MDDRMITCSSCEREVDGSLSWCPYCGAELGAGPRDPAAAVESEDGPGEERPGMGALLGIGAVVAAVLGAALVWFLVLRDDGGELSVLDAGPGDCWNAPTEAAPELTTLSEVPCSEGHDYEVFALVELDGAADAAYPGETALYTEALGSCLDAFPGYVGITFAESPLDVDVLFPSPDSWEEGDRETICSLYPTDGSIMDVSARDSGARLREAADDFADVGSCADLAGSALGVAQATIDVFDSYSEEEFADLVADAVLPEAMITIAKEETLLMIRAADLGCALEDLNAGVVARADELEASTQQGQQFADDVAAYGFFATE